MIGLPIRTPVMHGAAGNIRQDAPFAQLVKVILPVLPPKRRNVAPHRNFGFDFGLVGRKGILSPQKRVMVICGDVVWLTTPGAIADCVAELPEGVAP